MCRRRRRAASSILLAAGLAAPGARADDLAASPHPEPRVGVDWAAPTVDIPR